MPDESRPTVADTSLTGEPTPSTIVESDGDKAPAVRRAGLADGTKVGRYLVVGVLGQGGMGVVYDAYDATLHRNVALKMLQPTVCSAARAEAQRSRLLREAQALAQLSHPNVIAVHDVGTHEGQVFLAMAKLPGRVLGRWIRETSPTWREIVRAFVDAGRGLAAAHGAGLVHRDIKPDNILIGDDGRVLLIDFGLARAAEMTGDDEMAGIHESDETSISGVAGDVSRQASRLGSPVTRLGVVAGTPGYMAPEQYSGGVFNAYSDQFEFCAALYRALFGRRAFDGRTPKELRAATLAGRVREPPPTSKVPRRIRRVVMRGLSASPQDRYSSMEDLLAELAYDPRRLRTSIGVGVAMVGLAGLAATTWLTSSRLDAPAPCAEMEAPMNAVWNPEVRASLAAKLAPKESAVALRVTRLLDNYASAWSTMRQDTCRATRVTGQQSDNLLDLRMRCLERKRQAAASLIGLFTDERASELGPTAVQAVSRLPSLEECADVVALNARIPLPEAPELRKRIDAAWTKVNEAHALYLTGRYAEAKQSIDVLRPISANIGYAPLRVSTLLLATLIADTTAEPAEAKAFALDGILAAGEAKEDSFAARMWIALIGITSDLGDERSSLPLIRRATEAAIARAGNPRALRLKFLATDGAVLWDAGQFAPARVKLQRALKLAREDGADEFVRASILTNLANVLEDLGEFDAARTRYDEAIELKIRLLGPEHPDLAVDYSSLGVTAQTLGDLDEAWRYLERARSLWTTAHGAEHTMVAVALFNEGNVEYDRGRYESARDLEQHARRIFESALGPEHIYVAKVLDGLGRTYLALGDFVMAQQLLERSLEIFAMRAAKDSAAFADAQITKAELDQARGNCRRALPLFLESKRILAKVRGDDHPAVALALSHAAECELELGRAADARKHASEAADAVAAREVSPQQRALIRFNLARALWSKGGGPPRAQRSRARAEARAALKLLTGRVTRPELPARIRAWLRKH